VTTTGRLADEDTARPPRCARPATARAAACGEATLRRGALAAGPRPPAKLPVHHAAVRRTARGRCATRTERFSRGDGAAPGAAVSGGRARVATLAAEGRRLT
jgi:hypothetical protein